MSLQSNFSYDNLLHKYTIRMIVEMWSKLEFLPHLHVFDQSECCICVLGKKQVSVGFGEYRIRVKEMGFEGRFEDYLGR